jgi:hypothetical protein
VADAACTPRSREMQLVPVPQVPVPYSADERRMTARCSAPNTATP